MTFADATAGPWAAFRQSPSGVVVASPTDRLVWAVRYAVQITICPPAPGGACESPRPRTTTVILDFWTGSCLGTDTYSPNNQ